MNEQHAASPGLYIPAILFHNPDLTLIEKAVLSYIGDESDAANESLAKKFGVSKGHMCKVIGELVDGKYLRRTHSAGVRTLVAVKEGDRRA